jgi:hypothetical protein
MRVIHQTKYVVRVTIERSIRALEQAVKDMPYPVTPEDHAFHKEAVEAVERLKSALQLELPLVSS